MPQIDSHGLAAIKPALLDGENVLWTGRPDPSIVFHAQDTFMIPFSLLWGTFAVFWEAGVTGFWGQFAHPRGPSLFMILWGIPFVAIGQYMIWGRFILAAWKKKRTFYAVTNRRVLVVQDAWKHLTASAYIDTLPGITFQSRLGGFGTIRFGPSVDIFSRGRRGWKAWDTMAIEDVPVFVDIPDADSVYRLVSDLREKTTRPNSV
jgi:hypothetical protein